MNEPAALRVTLQPSRIAGGVTLVAVAATSALMAWLPIAPWLQALAVTTLGIYGIALVRTWGQRSTSRSVVAIMLGADRRITVVERNGRRTEGEVQEDSFVDSALTTIVWRGVGAHRSRTIAILPDMLLAEDFRKLRVLLRLGGAKAPAATTPAHR